MKSHKILYFLVLFSVFCMGCALTSQRSKIESDLNRIQQQNNLLMSDVQNLKSSSAETYKNLTEVVEKLYKANAKINENVKELQTKIDNLQGKIEELSYKLGKSGSRDISSTYNIGGETPEVPAEKSSDSQANQVFITAQNDFRRGYFDLAILGFKQFMTLTTDPAKLAEAQFWIGECYYSDNKLEDAIVEFDNFIRGFSKDSKVPGAMFKKAIAYFRLKKSSISKTIFQEIIKKYPESAEAKLAKERLSALENNFSTPE
ncbi:tol-pal system protein YbgF [bacterium]|nr:tol-pal system protein YbgF [bacterium]